MYFMFPLLNPADGFKIRTVRKREREGGVGMGWEGKGEISGCGQLEVNGRNDDDKYDASEW